jgi:hypothetical protein
MFQGLGLEVPGFAPICMDTNDPETTEAGFNQRVLRQVPEHGDLTALKAFVQRFCEEKLPKVTKLTFEEWLDSTSYDNGRKSELRQVFERTLGCRPSLTSCRKVKAFVKTESYPCYKHSRMINSRVDEFKVFSGPFFKAIENAVYDLPQFIKHIPVVDRPKEILKMRKSGVVYYQTDFTAFESHFKPEIMDAIELVLYRHCLSNYPEDSEFICNVLSGRNRISTRTGLKASVRARRMSGDMCTSLGNGFSNLMLALFIAESKGGELDGFVEGDDGLFSSTVPLTAEDYANLGFTIKIDMINDPCEGSFCGMIFSESGEIIRDPVKFLANFGWSHSFIGAGERVRAELMRAKALSAAYETPQCPIVGAMVKLGLKRTRGVCPRFVQDGYHDTSQIPRDERLIRPFAPSRDTRLLFEKMYGISVASQLYIEDAILCEKLDLIQTVVFPHPDMADYALKYIEKG